MRILTVGSLYPPHSFGGYELVWEGTVEHMRRSGHEVHVLASDYRRAGMESPDEPQLHRELRWYWRDHRWPRMSPLERARIERHNATVLDARLGDLRPDVVSWWSMGGMSLSLIQRVRDAGIPAVAIVCDDWLLYAPEVDGWQRLAGTPGVGRVLSALAGVPRVGELPGDIRCLFASDTLRRRAVERGVELRDPVVSHRGIDRDLFGPDSPRPWRWRLLFVGRIDPRKGIELAVRALAELPGEATLTILGGGDEGHLAELRRLVQAEGLGERVDFGVSAYSELPDRYAEADVVVFPVLWEEPWGLVPLEAMSVGTPVVASGRGGSGEYLRDGVNCLLFEPDHGPGALAVAIERLAGDESLRARLRKGGAETAAGFSVSRWDIDIERLHADAARREDG